MSRKAPATESAEPDRSRRCALLSPAEAVASATLVLSVLAFAILVRPINAWFARGIPENLAYVEATEDRIRDALGARPTDPWVALAGYRQAAPGPLKDELRTLAFRLFHAPSMQRLSDTRAQRMALYELARDFETGAASPTDRASWAAYSADIEPWNHPDVPRHPAPESVVDTGGLYDEGDGIRRAIAKLESAGATRIDKPAKGNDPNGDSQGVMQLWGSDHAILADLGETGEASVLILQGGMSAGIGTMIELTIDETRTVVYARDDLVLALRIPAGSRSLGIGILNPGGTGNRRLAEEKNDPWNRHTRLAVFGGVWTLPTEGGTAG